MPGSVSTVTNTGTNLSNRIDELERRIQDIERKENDKVLPKKIIEAVRTAVAEMPSEELENFLNTFNVVSKEG